MFELILIILFTLIFAYVAWWKLDWAIALAILFSPAYLLRFQASFLPMTILEVMVLVIFVVWVIKQMTKQNAQNNKVYLPWKWLTILWVLAGVLAVAISPDLRQALGLWKAYILEPILFFIVFVNTIKTKEQIRLILWALGALTVIVGFVALLQYAGLMSIPAPYGSQTPMRATSVFPFPTAVGKLLGPIVALFLGLLLSGDIKGYQGLSGVVAEKKQPLWAWIFPVGVLAFGAMALALSFSRGAIIGAFVSLVFISFFSRFKKILWLGIIAVIIVSFIVPFTRHELTSIVSAKDTSADVHVVMWKGAVRIVKANPILGTGLASFPIVYEKYKEASHTEFFPNPDELYLTLWIEMGLAGLVIFLWLVVKYFKAGVALIKNQDLQIKMYGVGLMAALITLLVHGFFDTPYFKNDLAIIFWVLVGLLVVCAKAGQNAQNAL
jgi:O-antigen ligase